MRKRTQIAMVLCLLAVGIMAFVVPGMAGPAERYLHVNVQDPTKGASVNVNVPVSLASKILLAINNPNLHDGKVSIHSADLNGVDVRALLDAVETAPDNEFVTVKDKDADVRVAKANGNIVIHVTDKNNGERKIDATVPLKIASALFATAKNDELDIASALQALSNAGGTLLVTVQDSGKKVRVWVDSRNAQD